MGKGQESLTRTQADCRSESLEIESLLGDVAMKQDVDRTIDGFVERFGRIDIPISRHDKPNCSLVVAEKIPQVGRRPTFLRCGSRSRGSDVA
jgi:hypothetical protein